jgi:hypothetical protein
MIVQYIECSVSCYKTSGRVLLRNLDQKIEQDIRGSSALKVCDDDIYINKM